MGIHNFVNFVQEYFGENQGLPSSGQATSQPKSNDEQLSPRERPPLPPWMEHRNKGEAISFTGESLHVENKIPSNGLPNLSAEVEQWGIDALAYYLPFHYYQKGWGIYFSLTGILHVAVVLKGGDIDLGDESLLNLSRQILFDHEAFHFMAEMGCSRSEVVARKPLYRPYFLHPYGAPHEEALANAHVYRRALKGQSSGLQAKILNWMKKQGSGYRDFERWLGAGVFGKGCDIAAEHMIEPISGQIQISARLPADFLFSGLNRFSIPTQLINDIGTKDVGIVKPFPNDFGMQVLVHTNDHPPPHIHIQQRQGAQETRYLWPQLIPYRGDSKLSASAEKGLQKYMAKYGSEIQKKVGQIYVARS